MTKEPGIKVTADGPYEVRGIPVATGRIVRTARGESIEWEVDEPYAAAKLVMLCRCGRSKTKPFCDDSHLEGRPRLCSGPGGTAREGEEGQALSADRAGR